MQATRVGEFRNGEADQALYIFAPSLNGHRYVVLSGVHNKWAHEVMAFPSDRTGEIISYEELACIRDTTDHVDLIEALGYEEVGS